MHDTDEQKRLNIALRRRQGQLEAIAKGNRKTLSLGKGIGLGGGLGAVWMLLIANPAVGAVVGAIALINYAAAALRESEKTGEYRPLLGRKSLSSLAMGLDRQSSIQPPSVTIEDDALYLEDRDLGEWLLLRTAMPQCIQFLSQCPEENRDEALDLAATEAYRTYGYMFRGEPDTRHQMKHEQVGQYAFVAVRQQSGHLLDAAPVTTGNDSIGMNTQLGAIAIPATVQSESTVEPEKARMLQQLAEHANQAKTQRKDIATSIATNLQSMLIVGQPGAGKGFLVAYAIREVKRLHPDVQIWVIDPKGAESEAWRWKPCDRYLPLKLNPFATTEEMIDAVQACSDLIRAFVSLGDVPKLLIFDEALAMREKAPKWFKECMTGFNALCSMGREKRQYGWLVSQSPNAEDFGISGAMRNVYRRVLVLSRSNLGLLDNGSTFFSGKPSDELLMETGRVYYDSIDGRWAVVPEWSQPTLPVQPVPHPTPEPRPAGDSRRTMLERSLQLETQKEEEDDTTVEKPDLPDREIFRLAIELEEWISQHPEAERKKWYGNFNANRKGLSRPQFRYLLTLTED
jgi:hypothetical protein